MNTTLTLSIILIFSILTNVFLVLYLRIILAKLLFVSENLGDLEQMIVNFNNHLASVYELETFYGDETLQNLLTHAKQVVEEIKVYKDIYTITNDETEQSTETPPA